MLRVFAGIFMGRWDGRETVRPSLYLLGHLLIAKVNASALSAWRYGDIIITSDSPFN